MESSAPTTSSTYFEMNSSSDPPQRTSYIRKYTQSRDMASEYGLLVHLPSEREPGARKDYIKRYTQSRDSFRIRITSTFSQSRNNLTSLQLWRNRTLIGLEPRPRQERKIVNRSRKPGAGN